MDVAFLEKIMYTERVSSVFVWATTLEPCLPDMKCRSEHISMLWQESGPVCLAWRGEGVEHLLQIFRL